MSQSKSDRLREIKDNDTRTRKLAVNIGFHRPEPSKVEGAHPGRMKDDGIQAQYVQGSSLRGSDSNHRRELE